MKTLVILVLGLIATPLGASIPKDPADDPTQFVEVLPLRDLVLCEGVRVPEKLVRSASAYAAAQQIMDSWIAKGALIREERCLQAVLNVVLEPGTESSRITFEAVFLKTSFRSKIVMEWSHGPDGDARVRALTEEASKEIVKDISAWLREENAAEVLATAARH